MVHLPIELCINVIEQLALPTHEYAYGLPEGTTSALCQLCLVNSFFKSWAQAKLYERVHLTPKNISSLWHCLQRRMFINHNWDLSKAPSIKSIAFTGFNEKLLIRLSLLINNILTFCSQSIERLLFDAAFRVLYSYEENLPIMEHFSVTLSALPGLVEFISIRDELYLAGWTAKPACWPEWPRIRRIALYNLELDSQFIDEVEKKDGLEKLCILNPRIDWPTTQNHPIPEFIRRAPASFQSLLLIDKEDWESDDYMTFTDLDVARTFLADGRVKMVSAHSLGGESLGVFEWYLELAMSGRLWELENYSIKKDDPITKVNYRDGDMETEICRLFADDADESDDDVEVLPQI